MNIFGYFFQKVHFKALRKKGTQKKTFAGGLTNALPSLLRMVWIFWNTNTCLLLFSFKIYIFVGDLKVYAMGESVANLFIHNTNFLDKKILLKSAASIFFRSILVKDKLI